MPNLFILAGPNGAGKTTYARDFLPAEMRCHEFVNADLIAAGLSPFRPASEVLLRKNLMLGKEHRAPGRVKSSGRRLCLPVLKIGLSALNSGLSTT